MVLALSVSFEPDVVRWARMEFGSPRVRQSKISGFEEGGGGGDAEGEPAGKGCACETKHSRLLMT